MSDRLAGIGNSEGFGRGVYNSVLTYPGDRQYSTAITEGGYMCLCCSVAIRYVCQ